MLTLGSSAWTDEPPPTDDISDHRIEALYSAITRWDRPEIIHLLAGLDLPLKTDELRADARRRLPSIVDAINDAEAASQEQEGQGVSVPADREPRVSAKQINPKVIDTRLIMIVSMAADRYGYRGPEKRGHAVRDIEAAMNHIGLGRYHQTIRDHLDEGAAFVEDGNWPDECG